MSQRWVCPFCGRTMGSGYEPSEWSCCGEVGHAIPEDDYDEQDHAATGGGGPGGEGEGS